MLLTCLWPVWPPKDWYWHYAYWTLTFIMHMSPLPYEFMVKLLWLRDASVHQSSMPVIGSGKMTCLSGTKPLFEWFKESTICLPAILTSFWSHPMIPITVLSHNNIDSFMWSLNVKFWCLICHIAAILSQRQYVSMWTVILQGNDFKSPHVVLKFTPWHFHKSVIKDFHLQLPSISSLQKYHIGYNKAMAWVNNYIQLKNMAHHKLSDI